VIPTRLVRTLVLLALAAGCSAERPPSTPVTPTPPPSAAPAPATLSATVTITSSNRFQPPEVRVLVGGRVTFVNQNTRAHDITSDPPHLHTDCPAIMDVGFIQPGQTKQTGALNTVRTCGFHDHMQENNPDLHGRIIIEGPN
jgi:plastocyanin